jgi:chemotaxis protein histidine kinase CheA
MPKKNQKNESKNYQEEGQLYDKILRENLLELFLPLVAEQLNFTIKKVTPLVDKQPTTVLRETDSFLLIETDSETEPKFILHIEFERKDNPNMIYRMVEYHGIELRKYKLPIKHVVVYLGDKTPKMRTSLQKEEIFESFTLVNIHETSPQSWLNYDEPERIIMAILGNYEKENAKIILEAILSKLRKVCKSDDDLKKFTKQLIIISRMRNLEELTTKISNKMPILIDIEKDYLYKLGLEKGKKLLLEAEEALENLKADFRVEAIAKAKAEAEKAAKAKVVAEKAAKEKAVAIVKAKAEAKKVAKAIAKAKVEAEKADKAKAAKEKAAAIAQAQAIAEKAAKEKAAAIAQAQAIAEKAAKEKAEAIAQAKTATEKAITKMKQAGLEAATIMDFLNLDKPTFDLFLMEIEQNKEL